MSEFEKALMISQNIIIEALKNGSGWSGNDLGISGFSGISGYSGKNGEKGESGSTGEKGYSGTSGISGQKGIDGFGGNCLMLQFTEEDYYKVLSPGLRIYTPLTYGAGNLIVKNNNIPISIYPCIIPKGNILTVEAVGISDEFLVTIEVEKII